MINLSWEAVIREDGRQHNIIRLFVLCGSAGGGEGRRGEPLPARHPLIDSGIKVVPCDE